jgi:hypothetical protein
VHRRVPERGHERQRLLAGQAACGGDRDRADGRQPHAQVTQVTLQIAFLLLGADRIGQRAQLRLDVVGGRHAISMAAAGRRYGRYEA